MAEPDLSGLKVLIEFLLAVGVVPMKNHTDDTVQHLSTCFHNSRGPSPEMFLVCEILNSLRKIRRVESKPYFS